MPATAKKYMVVVIALTLLLYNTGSAAPAKFIDFSDSRINYEGRIGTLTGARQLYWAGSTINIVFKGIEVWAKMNDEKGDSYYTVIIDNDSIRKMPLVKGSHLYKLCDDLTDTTHTLTLFKSTQWDKGSTLFYGFMLGAGTKLLAWVNTKKRAIEFYGNSITCGSAVEDTAGHNSGGARYENNYLSYAAITARHYNAAYQCIARSGIGLMVSWYPLIMPEMYNRLNPRDVKGRWNFTQFTPGIVVVNLMQNDSWLVKLSSNEQFIKRFGKKPPTARFIVAAYKQFITGIRNKYPNTNIICALGSMDAVAPDSPWPSFIQQAVQQMHDKKIYAFFFPYKNTPGHPGISEQRQMAESLICFIDGNIKW